MGTGVGLGVGLGLGSGVGAAFAVHLPTLASSPILVVGKYKAVLAYSGPAITVRHTSNGAEADVTFDGQWVKGTSLVTVTMAGSSGYTVGQQMALSTFLGANLIGRVKTKYDQSGNGNHQTQTTTSNQGYIYIRPDGYADLPGGKFPLPNGYNRNNFTQMLVGRQFIVIYPSGMYYSRYSTTYAALAPNSAYTVQQLSDNVIVNTAPNHSAVPGSTLSVMEINNGATSRTSIDTDTATATGLTSSVLGGGQSEYGDDTGYNETLLALYPASLSSGDTASFRGFSALAFGTHTSHVNTISWYGDSIFFGYNQPEWTAPHRLVADSLTNTRVLNFAASSTLIPSNFQTGILDPNANNILVCNWGSNNLRAGQSAATVFGLIQTACQNAKTKGYTKCVWATVLPASDGLTTEAIETERLALNTMLRGAAFLDALIDGAADAMMGVNGSSLSDPARSSNSMTYYQGDKLHLQAAGYSRLLPLQVAALASVGVT